MTNIALQWMLMSVVLVAAPRALSAQPIRVDVSRDTWVSAYPGEENANLGGSDKLKTKGVQEFSLLDIDPQPLRGKTIRSATLHLHCRSKDIGRRLTVSSLASTWVEGTSKRYAKQPGSASFLWARQGKQYWAWPGSDMTAVMCGEGHTIWRSAPVTKPDAQGYQTVSVDPQVVAARVAGISQGFVLFDDIGSEWKRAGEKFTYHTFPNRLASSRQAGRRRAPYFTIELGPDDRQPPHAVARIVAIDDDLPPGEAFVMWKLPEDRGDAGTIGFFVRFAQGDRFDWDKAKEVPRYLIPMAPTTSGADDVVVMHLRDLGFERGQTITLGIRPVDRAGNVGPLTTQTIAVSDRAPEATIGPSTVQPFTKIAPNPTIGQVSIAIIDPLDKVHPVSGKIIPRPSKTDYRQANHLWSAAAKKIRLYAAKNEFVGFQIVLTGQTERLDVKLTFDHAANQAPQARLLRFRHVQTKHGPLPDPLVPLERAITIPYKSQKIPGQQHATLLADIYVPHEAPAGGHRGRLKLTTGDQSVAIDVELNVWQFTLPDQLSFIPQMNAYGLPGKDVPYDYYRLAHEHRTCLNRLPYNWRGQVADTWAPRRTGNTFDWSGYDKRIGPLLDGSAFSQMPRKAVPVDAIYLPLNEAWPIPISEGYKGGYWADEALSDKYRAAWVQASRQFAEHVRQKGWHRTFFEFYLNNKVYHKRQGWSRSSAPWVFDEPANIQDFWALRWYGLAFHEGVAQALPGAARRNIHMVYRCDISRPQWQRDILDGILNINVVGASFHRYHRLIDDRKRRSSEVTYQYGTTNAVHQSNVQPAAWCIDVWSRGGDGVVPWQTIGKEQSWTTADTLSLFYPPRRRWRRPVPSVRLKAYRRGQQDVEYLTMLSQVMKQPRWAVGRAVRRELALKGVVKQSNPNDAGRISYRRLSPRDLWRLRMRVGAMLDKQRPPAKRMWYDLRDRDRQFIPIRAMPEGSELHPRVRDIIQSE